MEFVSPARVLIIEDERLVAAELEIHLQGLGHLVVGVASSAEQALNLAERARPDLLLVDVRLAEGDGIEVASRILERHSAAVVFVTAHHDPVTLGRARRLIPAGYLLKPVDEHALAVTVDLAVHAFREAQARRSLEQRVRHAERMEAVGRLASGVAHDLNNVLLAVELNAWLLVTDRANDPAEQIQTAVAHGATLTNQLLALARGRDERPVPVDLRAAIRGYAPLLARVLGPARLDLDLLPGLPPVRLVPGRAEQVLLNLVMNAREVVGADGRVEVSTRWGPDGTVELAVSDDGPGVPPELSEAVFEPFFTTRARGTGLGLATVREIATESGGALTLDPFVRGRGATFRVRWPAAQVGSRGPTPTPVPEESTLGCRVLVVIPNELVRAAVIRALETAGHTAIEALGSGHALLRAETDEGPLDVIVADQALGAMPPDELWSVIRRAHEAIGLVVIADGPCDLPHEIVRKPVAFEALQVAVRRAALRFRGRPRGPGGSTPALPQ